VGPKVLALERLRGAALPPLGVEAHQRVLLVTDEKPERPVQGAHQRVLLVTDGPKVQRA